MKLKKQKVDLRKEKQYLERGDAYTDVPALSKETSNQKKYKDILITKPAGRRFIEQADSTAKVNPKALQQQFESLDNYTSAVTNIPTAALSRKGYVDINGKRTMHDMKMDKDNNLMTNEQGQYISTAGIPVSRASENYPVEIVRNTDALLSDEKDSEAALNYVNSLVNTAHIKSGKLSDPPEVPQLKGKKPIPLSKEKVPISFRK